MDLPELTPEQKAQVDEFARKLGTAGETAQDVAKTDVGKQLFRKGVILVGAAAGLFLSGAFTSRATLTVDAPAIDLPL